MTRPYKCMILHAVTTTCIGGMRTRGYRRIYWINVATLAASRAYCARSTSMHVRDGELSARVSPVLAALLLPCSSERDSA